jgi:hypothetical protein
MLTVVRKNSRASVPTDKATKVLQTKFLFMDEKYAEQGGPVRSRVTSLSGVLVPASLHQVFRQRFYQIVVETMRDPEGIINELPEIHAANIFPQFGDDDGRRFDFIEGLVDLVVSLGIKIFRVGYVRSPQMVETFGDERSVLGLCFHGLLDVLKTEMQTSQIWPVMEIDRSAKQDSTFAGAIRRLDHMTQRLPRSVSIDNQNLGEVLYSTKQSAHGTVADFVAYLRHAAYLDRENLIPLTQFKKRLVEISKPLDKVVGFEEVITMQFSQPPADYDANGPYRHAVRIDPKV